MHVYLVALVAHVCLRALTHKARRKARTYVCGFQLPIIATPFRTIACLSSCDASRLATGRCSYAWKFLVQAVMGPRRNLPEVAARPRRRLNMVTLTLWESPVSGYCLSRALPFLLKFGRLAFPILPSSSPPAFPFSSLRSRGNKQFSGWLF